MNRVSKLKLAVKLAYECRVSIRAHRFPESIQNHTRTVLRVFRTTRVVKRLIVSPEAKLVPHASAEPHVQPSPHLVFRVAEDPVTVFWLQPFGFENLDCFIYSLWLVRDGTAGEQHDGEGGDNSCFHISRY